MTVHIDNGTFGQPPYGAPRGTLCGLAYGDGWDGEVITHPDELDRVTCPACRPDYTLHYTSADAPGDSATWSVYRELYLSADHDEPIDGTQEYVSTHPSEAEADAEARRLQREAVR